MTAPFTTAQHVVGGSLSATAQAFHRLQRAELEARVGRVRAGVIYARKQYAAPVMGSFVGPGGNVFRTAT